MQTAFTRLVGCTVPIQQAGMGGVTTSALVAAVADAGALGMLAGVRFSAPALASALDALSQRTRGTFGVNFLMPFLNREAVEIAASRSKLVEFFYADPEAELVDMVHAGGALACWQIGSLEEAKLAAAAGCDLIVAQGVEAGGHVRGQTGLLALLAQVLGAVDVPVVAAGGIGNAAAMAAAIGAGAAAVRVGTRFVAALEADANPAYVEALIAAGPGDTELTQAFSVGWPDAPHRVLASSIRAAAEFDGDVTGEVFAAGAERQIARFSTAPPTRSTKGAIAAMALYAGESVGDVTRVEGAADIIRELNEGAAAILGRGER